MLREDGVFQLILMTTPEVGGPGVSLDVEPVSLRDLSAWKPPEEPALGSPMRFARPSDQAGAIYDDDGKPLDGPRGSIGYTLGIFVRLAVRAAFNDKGLPTQRPGSGRHGRPSQIDFRGVLRILLGQVERCTREQAMAVTPPICVALMLWHSGYCHPGPPPPPGLRDPMQIKGLPTVDEVEPWVTTANSIRRMAGAIRNLARGRAGEYKYAGPKRPPKRLTPKRKRRLATR